LLFLFIEGEYGIVEIEEINHIAIRGYVEYLSNKGLSETYINGLIKCFKSYFIYSMRERYIFKNPINKVYRAERTD